MSWQKTKLGEVVKQYRIEHIVQNNVEYKQVTISKHTGVNFRGIKKGKDIGRKRQFLIDLNKYPKTLLFVRQGVQDGSIGIAPIEVDGCIVTENMPMFSIEGIDSEFLDLIIKSKQFQEEVSKITTTGSAQKSIHERHLLEIEFPCPDIDQQRQIVNSFIKSKELNSLLKDELSSQTNIVSQLRQAFLREAMQGKLVPQDPNDEPASELLKRIKEKKEKLIAEGKIKKQKPLPEITPEEEPYEIPPTWVWCRLGELVNIKSGKRIHASDYTQQGIPFLRSGEIGTLGRGEKLLNQLFISQKKYNEVKAKFGIPKHGDILIACIGGSIGNTWVVDNREFYYKDGNLVLIESIPEILTSYLLSYLKSSFFWKNTILNATDSSYNALTIEKLNESELPLPPIAEQQRIVSKLNELMQFCDQLEQNINTTKEQTNLLLQTVLREALEPGET